MDDAQLAGVLDETATWALIGCQREVLYRAASLRQAIKIASPLGTAVRAISGGTDDNLIVIVFGGQIERMAEIIREETRANHAEQ